MPDDPERQLSLGQISVKSKAKGVEGPISSKKPVHCKMLVLGSADTGKSTLVRNIRMIHNVDFTEEEIARFKNRIRTDCLTALAYILKMADFERGATMDLKHDAKELESHVNRYVRTEISYPRCLTIFTET